jgi:hypothetical protein
MIFRGFNRSHHEGQLAHQTGSRSDMTLDTEGQPMLQVAAATQFTVYLACDDAIRKRAEVRTHQQRAL